MNTKPATQTEPRTTAQINGSAAAIARMVTERQAAVTAVDLGAKR